jgi:hypothetical protein
MKTRKTLIEKLLTNAGAAVLLVTAASSAAFAQTESEKSSKKDFEVVLSAGLNVPDPLVPQTIESFVDEYITTTRTGRLLVTKSIDLSASCTTGTGVLYYLVVDDEPMRSSAVFSRTGVIGQVSGVSADIVEAGFHRIRIGAQCTAPGADVNGGSVTLVGITTVIVLP